MRLEYAHGRSFKHWHGEQIGSYVVYRWGRIGQPERRAVSHYITKEAAAHELQRRLRAKIRKGYTWCQASYAQLSLPFAPTC